MASRGFAATRTALTGLALILGLAGCAAPEPTPTTSALIDDFEAELPIEVSFTVLDVDYSLEELAGRAARSLEIFEPFDQADTEFTVIDLGQLLLDSGLTETDEIVTVALNDYRYTDTVQAFIETGALLALYENGQPIPVSEGGPVRIVFDESSSYYGFLDAWNWSLSYITKSGE